MWAFVMVHPYCQLDWAEMPNTSREHTADVHESIPTDS